MTTKQKILEVRGLHTYYGSIHALKGIDLDSLKLEEVIKQALKKMVKG